MAPIVDAAGHLTHFVAVQHDVTGIVETPENEAVRATEEAVVARTRELDTALVHVEKRRRFTETILNSMVSGILATDRAGTVTFANLAALQTLGTSLADCVGRPVVELFGHHPGLARGDPRRRAGTRRAPPRLPDDQPGWRAVLRRDVDHAVPARAARRGRLHLPVPQPRRDARGPDGPATARSSVPSLRQQPRPRTLRRRRRSPRARPRAPTQARRRIRARTPSTRHRPVASSSRCTTAPRPTSPATRSTLSPVSTGRARPSSAWRRPTTCPRSCSTGTR